MNSANLLFIIIILALIINTVQSGIIHICCIGNTSPNITCSGENATLEDILQTTYRNLHICLKSQVSVSKNLDFLNQTKVILEGTSAKNDGLRCSGHSIHFYRIAKFELINISMANCHIICKQFFKPSYNQCLSFQCRSN